MKLDFGKLRRAQLLVVFALVLALGAVIISCSPQEDPNMALFTTTTRPPVTIPALDAAAPTQIETATFALG